MTKIYTTVMIKYIFELQIRFIVIELDVGVYFVVIQDGIFMIYNIFVFIYSTSTYMGDFVCVLWEGICTFNLDFLFNFDHIKPFPIIHKRFTNWGYVQGEGNFLNKVLYRVFYMKKLEVSG